jgi:cobalt-precorrin-5B (C1)-methyltransferase
MMRYGFTTGSCAAAASKAAAYMLLTGKLKQNITIQTPKGILFQTEILEITRSETEVTCAVRKDGGDDPDITSGTLIFSTVRFADGEKKITGQNNRQLSAFLYLNRLPWKHDVLQSSQCSLSPALWFCLPCG